MCMADGQSYRLRGMKRGRWGKFNRRYVSLKKGYNVAIDGPAGAGKSTIAKRIAKR